MTNAIPAMGIAAMSIGLVNRDGIIIFLGSIISIIGVLVALAAVFYGVFFITYLFSFFSFS